MGRVARHRALSNLPLVCTAPCAASFYVIQTVTALATFSSRGARTSDHERKATMRESFLKLSRELTEKQGERENACREMQRRRMEPTRACEPICEASRAPTASSPADSFSFCADAPSSSRRDEPDQPKVGPARRVRRLARGKDLERDVVRAGRDARKDLGRHADRPAEVPVAGELGGLGLVAVEICGRGREKEEGSWRRWRGRGTRESVQEMVSDDARTLQDRVREREREREEDAQTETSPRS